MLVCLYVSMDGWMDNVCLSVSQCVPMPQHSWDDGRSPSQHHPHPNSGEPAYKKRQSTRDKPPTGNPQRAACNRQE